MRGTMGWVPPPSLAAESISEASFQAKAKEVARENQPADKYESNIEAIMQV